MNFSNDAFWQKGSSNGSGSDDAFWPWKFLGFGSGTLYLPNWFTTSTKEKKIRKFVKMKKTKILFLYSVFVSEEQLWEFRKIFPNLNDLCICTCLEGSLGLDIPSIVYDNRRQCLQLLLSLQWPHIRPNIGNNSGRNLADISSNFLGTIHAFRY